MRTMTNGLIRDFENYLVVEEKSSATIEKYLRDIRAFYNFVDGRTVKKELLIEYKKMLMEKFAPSSVNSVLSGLNMFFDFNQWYELKVKLIKIQKQIFLDKEKELSKQEYERLLTAAKAKGNRRLYYLMQTICSTGIRVSELRFITVDAVNRGQALINCKGKMRVVIIPRQLAKILKKYATERKIFEGAIFVTKNKKPLDRSNIWADMKKLCEMAGVSKDKVFPHNLRHLFARTYYSLQKDVVRLADILGHTSVNTTRIYTMESGDEHRRQIQKLGLLRC